MTAKIIIPYYKAYLGPEGYKVWHVAYALFDNFCVFTGIDRFGSSTINYAEEVIAAICARENRRPTSLIFFDLQTCRGYHKPPGVYSYDHLELEIKKGKAWATAWQPTLLPEHVAKLFEAEIGDPSAWLKALTPAEAEEMGFTIHLFSSDDEQEMLRLAIEATRGTVGREIYTFVDNTGSPPHLLASGGLRYTLWSNDGIAPDKLIRIP